MSASTSRVYFLLQRTAHRLKTEADSLLIETNGLTTAQAAVMSVVATHGPVTQRYVASRLSQRESAVTTMTARLLKAGYITKTRSSSDARAWELNATASGKRALVHMQAAFDRINAVLDERIGGEDIDRMAAILTEILAVFEVSQRD